MTLKFLQILQKKWVLRKNLLREKVKTSGKNGFINKHLTEQQLQILKYLNMKSSESKNGLKLAIQQNQQ